MTVADANKRAARASSTDAPTPGSMALEQRAKIIPGQLSLAP
jgi:hypothetical protein